MPQTTVNGTRCSDVDEGDDGQTWRGCNPEGLAHEKRIVLEHGRGLDPACRAVFDRGNVTARLAEIRVPKLVICGAAIEHFLARQ